MEKARARTIALMAFAYVMIFAMIAGMFMLAGRWDYWQGWLFGALLVLRMVASTVLFADKPEFVFERVNLFARGTKWWDRVFWAFYGPAFFAVFVIAPLDAGRFGWSGELPLWAYAAGYAAVFAGFSIHVWSMWVNRFFVSTVRLQKGQAVIQEGPYKIVRHPGYVAGILLAAGSSLALGSYWGLVPAGMVAVLLIIRTQLEDETLRKELKGYKEYAKKVRYRLLPGVW